MTDESRQAGANARKIAVVTGTRAEYGLFVPLLRQIEADPGLLLQLVVTGAHLVEEFGFTVREIEADGFPIARRVDIDLELDTPVGVARSTGLAMERLARAFDELSPDMVVLLGDRFETLAAASAAALLRVPVAHIHGGEVSEGAVDEVFRHAITKMSHLHFTSTRIYRRRVIQMGEDPARVFFVGALGMENIRSMALPDREEIGRVLDVPANRDYLLVTFHPETLKSASPEADFRELLRALDEFPEVFAVFTRSNADAGGRAVNRMMEAYAQENPGRSRVFASLGMPNYLGALKYAAAAVGNSSSGILEAPGVGTPTVNVGDRQKGRIRAGSVMDVPPVAAEIAKGIRTALTPEFAESCLNMENPYEKPGTSGAIARVLKTHPLEGIVKKSFYDLPDTGGEGGEASWEE